MQWFIPIVLDTAEANIKKIAVEGQPGQKDNKTPPQPIKC
jgi:hypothetical protein